MDGPIPFLERFRQDLQGLAPLEQARGILIAASGGPDSTALVRLFAALRDLGMPGLPPLSIGHVHHGIRGREADRDRAFVRELARARDLPYLETSFDVPTLARSGRVSLETAARNARHSTFSVWTREHPIDLVALGHNGDDQAETVLLRIFRGAGLRGLGGIPAERPLVRGQARQFPRLIRPLLRWRREEIMTYLNSLGQTFQVDSTNRDPSIRRNRIRHQLLPFLRQEFEPGVDRKLQDIARVATRASADLETLAREALSGVVLERNPGAWELSAPGLRRLLPTIRYHVLEIIGTELRGHGEGFTPSASRMGRVVSWLEGDPPRRGSLDLGNGLRAEFHRDILRILTGEQPPVGAPLPPVEFSLPGRVRWGDWEIWSQLASQDRGDDQDHGHRNAKEDGASGMADLSEVVDRSSLSQPLWIRSRQPGDRLRPLGSPGTKKLKEFFRERGVDPRTRNSVPILVDAREIVWVVGHRITERYRVRPGSRDLVHLGARIVGNPGRARVFPESPA